MGPKNCITIVNRELKFYCIIHSIPISALQYLGSMEVKLKQSPSSIDICPQAYGYSGIARELQHFELN